MPRPKSSASKSPSAQSKTCSRKTKPSPSRQTTLKQAYYFQHKAEDKENFSLNAGIQDKYEEEYDQEFWDDYHNNHSVEEEVSFVSETGTIDESGQKTITSKEELKNTAKKPSVKTTTPRKRKVPDEIKVSNSKK